MLVQTPKPPYIAVLFSSVKAIQKANKNYVSMNKQVSDAAKQMQGYLGCENFTSNDKELTISYWKTLEDVELWKTNTIHLIAKNKGIEEWYESYAIRICEVKRDNFFTK